MQVNWFTPLYALSIFGIIRFFYSKKGDDKTEIRWTPVESVGVTLGIYFGSQLVGGVIALLIARLAGKRGNQAVDWLGSNTYGQFIFIVMISVITIWAVHNFLKLRRANFATIGLKSKPKWINLLHVALSFLGYIICFLIITSIVKALAPSLDVNQKQQIGFESYTSLQLPFIFASLVLLPPVTEELLVRGFLYAGLRNKLKKWQAVIITSAIFGIAHLQAGSGEPLLWVAGIDTFVLSLFLIHLKEKTGNLWASMGLHMLKNFVAFLSLFVFHLG